MDRDQYGKAKKLGDRAYQQAVTEGRYPYLPALEDILRGHEYLSEEHVGELEIPVSLIRGTYTHGRQEAFADNYMPLLPGDSEFASKWSAVYQYQMSEGIHDAVKVYEYMGNFYIIEGNKRVSVLRYLEQPTILADVTRRLPAPSDSEEYKVYQEFLRFFRSTRLYSISFSREGSYEKLAELLGRSLDAPWPEEAVRSLKSTYYYFQKIYKAIGGNDLSLSSGDAFLLYLHFYPAGSLITESEKVIRQRLEHIWKEFRIKAGGDRIVFSENPQTGTGRKSFLSALLHRPRLYSVEKPLVIAFMYDGTPETSRWNNAHEQGRLRMEHDMRGFVRTLAYPNTGFGDSFDAAVRTAVSEGAGLIVTTSPTQMEDALKAAAMWPDVRFINCSVHLHRGLVRTYYARLYESKFLLGVLAATLAKDHRIGYVCNYPICGAVANINAFAIGASMVDPEAKIYLTWSCLRNHNWRDEIYGKGLTLISGPDLVKPQKIDVEYGLYEHLEDGSIRNIASPLWKWHWYYDLIAITLLNDAWDNETSAIGDQALNYWWGMSSGVIDLDLTENVPPAAAKLSSALKKAIISGITSPFDGELRSQTGLIQKAGSPSLSADAIVNMDWLNENITGSLPEWDELTDTAKRAVRVNGLPVSGKAEL